MKRMLRGLLVLGLLILAGAGFSGRLDVLAPFAVATQAASSVRILDAVDQDANAAVQQVIQRSNEEQVQAIARRDSSVMADTSTASHYQELVRINQNLLNN